MQFVCVNLLEFQVFGLCEFGAWQCQVKIGTGLATYHIPDFAANRVVFGLHAWFESFS